MDFTNFTEEKLFKGGEMPGSEASYWRDLEIKRRQHIINERVAEAQIEAATAQKEAAEATKTTAVWTRVSAIAMTVSVLAVLVAAFIARGV